MFLHFVTILYSNLCILYHLNKKIQIINHTRLSKWDSQTFNNSLHVWVSNTKTYLMCLQVLLLLVMFADDVLYSMRTFLEPSTTTMYSMSLMTTIKTRRFQFYYKKVFHFKNINSLILLRNIRTPRSYSSRE